MWRVRLGGLLRGGVGGRNRSDCCGGLCWGGLGGKGKGEGETV